jgi:hypothetical protein
MLYEIRYEVNGREVSKGVRADSCEEALAKFREDWSPCPEDEPPAAPWVAGCMAEE